MTRKEQIKEQLKELPKDTFDSVADYVTYCAGFYDGVAWADEHPDNGLDFEPKPLEECIEAATPTWQGVDVDAYLDEVRGREPANRWISVDDALPEVYEPVLAAAGNHFAVVAIRDNFDWYYSEFVGEKISGITHWQRLPAPPKKGGN